MQARGGFSHRSDFLPTGVGYPNLGLPPKKPCHSVRSSVYSVHAPAVKTLVKKAEPRPDPLFLFYCGSRWHRAADTASGWELVQAMRSTDTASRAVAAELLAETENGRLLVRDLRRTRSSLLKIVRFPEPATQQLKPVETEPMKTPYGLDMVENCITCKLRKEGWYCSLPEDLLTAFSGHSHLTTYPGGAILFVAGQMPRGAFVLCSGKVKLSTTSKEGKVLVLKMVEPGEIIGLSAMISGEAYEVTAEPSAPAWSTLWSGKDCSGLWNGAENWDSAPPWL